MQDLSGLELKAGIGHAKLVGLWMQMNATQNDPVSIPVGQMQLVAGASGLQYRYRPMSSVDWENTPREEVVLKVVVVRESPYLI